MDKRLRNVAERRSCVNHWNTGGTLDNNSSSVQISLDSVFLLFSFLQQYLSIFPPTHEQLFPKNAYNEAAVGLQELQYKMSAKVTCPVCSSRCWLCLRRERKQPPPLLSLLLFFSSSSPTLWSGSGRWDTPFLPSLSVKSVYIHMISIFSPRGDRMIKRANDAWEDRGVKTFYPVLQLLQDNMVSPLAFCCAATCTCSFELKRKKEFFMHVSEMETGWPSRLLGGKRARCNPL